MLERRKMNEDRLEVREANHRVMNMSDQGRPSAERRAFPPRPNFWDRRA